MTELLDLMRTLGQWSLPNLWLPLLAWTLLALPIHAALRRADRWHPLVQYRLRQALLFALPAGLVAAAWIDASALGSWLAAWGASPGEPGGVALPLAPTASGAAGAAAPSDAPQLTGYHALGVLTGMALLLGAVKLVRLARSALALVHFHAGGTTLRDVAIQRQARRLATSLGIRRPVAVRLATEDDVVPMTYGVLYPTILLPRSLATQSDGLRMTLTHELIHIRRCDFLARWIEQLVAAVFAIHPGALHLARSVESAREIACDAEAIRRANCGRKAYADLLCGFATLPAHRPASVLSIAETPSSLKQRIEAMTLFDRFKDRFPRYTPLLALMLLAVLGLGIVACSDAVTPPTSDDASEEAAVQSAESDDEVFIVVEDRPELIGGMRALQETIEYPETAKQAGIEGRVFVQFVVDENGEVQDAQVTRGVHELLDRAAVEAVEHMEFEPGKNRGEPVKTQMSLPVTFRLGNYNAEDTDGSASKDESDLFEKAGIETTIQELTRTGNTLSGRLVDAETETPIVGANVVVRWDGDEAGAATDSEGHFTLRIPADEMSRLTAPSNDAPSDRPALTLHISHANYENAQIGIPSDALASSRLNGEGTHDASRFESSDVSGRANLDKIPITIRSDGSVLIAGTATPIHDIASTLQRHLSSSTTEPIIALDVDGNASMGTVLEVQKQLRDAGTLKVNYRSS